MTRGDATARGRVASRYRADDAGNPWNAEVTGDEMTGADRCTLRDVRSRDWGLDGEGRQKSSEFALSRSSTPNYSIVSYSTSSFFGSSAAILSERRKRRSLAVMSNASGGPRLGRRRHLDHRAPPLSPCGIGAVDETDNRFERTLSFRTLQRALLAARLDLRIICDSSSNGIGELAGQPVDDVIHCLILLTGAGAPYT